MENKTIIERISALRHYMQQKGLHAFIVPSSDVHQSEYPPAHWASREWISGFTGSAGTVVVTLNKAGLWTDSRYFIQAEKELQRSGIELFKEGVVGVPTISEWLSDVLSAGQTVGVDGDVFSAKSALALQSALSLSGLQMAFELDPFVDIWGDRPEIPRQSVFAMPEEISGASTAEKIEKVRQALKAKSAESLVVASLDTLAWLFNLRGSDVPYNPVFVAFGYVSMDEAILFIYPEKVSQEIAHYLVSQGVTIAHYEKTYEYLSKLSGKRILLQSDKVSYRLYDKIHADNLLIDSTSVADLLKASKNSTELQGFKNAMKRDGVALVQFLMWLEQAMQNGEEINECTIADKLVEYRSKQDKYVGESFGTIAGYQANGAIVHYHAHEEECSSIRPKGFLLIDSGAQYFDGTTDITRTVALGELTTQMKTDYTLVLKGHIALARAVFPQGTRGAQLDVLARQFLWHAGANYLHGTGHGIGHFLNVHEGPQNIRLEENPTPLEVGMVVSNEPGVYRSGQYGIRIENLQVVMPTDIESEFGLFYHFETLTRCPIDTTPIQIDLLTEEEREWINNYHSTVYQELSPALSPKEQVWLKQKTEAI